MRTRRPLIAGSVCMQAGELRAGCITGSAVRAHVHVRVHARVGALCARACAHVHALCACAMCMRTRRPLTAGSAVRTYVHASWREHGAPFRSR